MIANLNASDSIFQLKMDELNEYMEARELPIQLRYEIREFFYNARLSAESKLNNETKILAELSALLRSKIAFAINDSVLNKMPFFVGADHNFLMELALSMRMVCFPPHEEVILEGEIGEEMFFIFRGVVEVLRNGQQITILGEKQYFGEMAILNQNCLRTATVRTLCFCELRMLTREKFLIALNHYPSMKQRIAKIVEQRQKGSAVLSLLTRTFKSSKDFVGSIPADMDDKIEKQLTTSSEKTSNSQLNPVNTTALSRSFKSFTTEADIEQIRSKLNLLMQRQEKMLNLLDRMDEQVGQVNN
jgi:CRP-like cAMP-binding protein